MARPSNDSPQPNLSPDFSFETELHQSGLINVCGVDEAGRGPLAGPVTAAAVILDPQHIPEGLHDSKKLSVSKRERLFGDILATSHVGLANISAATIDDLNIRNASLYAMRLAIHALPVSTGHALIDGNAEPSGLPCPCSAIVKGDARSLSIAAASIIAKVTRDRLMVKASKFYPLYGLVGHKGYPTKTHRETLAIQGATRFHRQSFGPVAVALKR